LWKGHIIRPAFPLQLSDAQSTRDNLDKPTLSKNRNCATCAIGNLPKRVWFSSGIHHHYSTQKFIPAFTEPAFRTWFYECGCNLLFGESSNIGLEIICEVLFSNAKYSRRTSQESQYDLLSLSCNNFYKDVSQTEAEAFYDAFKQNGNGCAPSYGLNSRLTKEKGQLKEEVWYLKGKYGKAIENIVHWLNKAMEVAENEMQCTSIQLLINFYKTGNLELFDKYSINWLADQQSTIDFVNGFIEVYGDPLGLKGSWEALVNVMDKGETTKVKTLSDNAQWFEDRSPIEPGNRKPVVSGVSMKIIEAVMLGGDCYPASPLGINLPNADWIREKHGSKSVSLSNISNSHHLASLNSGVIEEFAATDEEIALHKKYGSEADHLHTHLHECLGHGSGRLKQGVTTDMLKAYGSVIEEARADLFALYFMMDPKMIELGLSPHPDLAKTHYNSYIRNGLLVQLTRIELGNNIEQAHMRNRQLIAKWTFEHGSPTNTIEKIEKNGKTYYKVNNYETLRQLFGKLLFEIQRIKSEGDYDAAKQMVETYGVTIDQTLHQQVLQRFKKLNIAPFAGFVNPRLNPIMDSDGNVSDITIDYTECYQEQMLRYGREYGFLETEAIHEFLKEC
jgi:dipeptidyl-peptidase III